MGGITFANPGYFYLLLLVLVAIVGYIFKLNKLVPTVQLSQTKAFGNKVQGNKNYFRHLPFGLRCIAMICVILVLARPQIFGRSQTSSTEGIDIVLAMDLSTSMLAEDLKPNRIEASKQVGIQFVAGRKNDQIGLVVFEGASFTQCPLTTDHTQVINLMNSLQCGLMDEGGTAIGMGLVTALNKLKDSHAKSRVVILLTDGVNNTGDVAPITAAEMAKTMGVRVYTIGLGTHGTAKTPVQTNQGVRYVNVPVDVDDKGLTAIADATGGEYFRATSTDVLKKVYQQIDQLEKSKIQTTQYRQAEEVYFWFALIAFLCILLEIITRITVLRQII